MKDPAEEEFDQQTGELFPVVTASERASAAVTPPSPEPLGGRGLDEALFRAQEELPNWVKAEKAGARGKYAPLGVILSVVRPIFANHGIRIRQGADRSWPMDEGGGTKGRLIPVWTELIHTPTGERERTTLEMPLPKMDPQGMGSAITYGRRYSLLAAIGLASDEADDDGARARRTDVTEQHDESAALIALKAEINAVKDVPALVAWATNTKTKRQIEDLDEGEAVLLRQHWAKRKADLLDGVDELAAPPPPAQKKKTKAAPAEPVDEIPHMDAPARATDGEDQTAFLLSYEGELAKCHNTTLLAAVIKKHAKDLAKLDDERKPIAAAMHERAKARIAEATKAVALNARYDYTLRGPVRP